MGLFLCIFAHLLNQTIGIRSKVRSFSSGHDITFGNHIEPDIFHLICEEKKCKIKQNQSQALQYCSVNEFFAALSIPLNVLKIQSEKLKIFIYCGKKKINIQIVRLTKPT